MFWTIVLTLFLIVCIIAIIWAIWVLKECLFDWLDERRRRKGWEEARLHNNINRNRRL